MDQSLGIHECTWQRFQWQEWLDPGRYRNITHRIYYILSLLTLNPSSSFPTHPIYSITRLLLTDIISWSSCIHALAHTGSYHGRGWSRVMREGGNSGRCEMGWIWYISASIDTSTAREPGLLPFSNHLLFLPVLSSPIFTEPSPVKIIAPNLSCYRIMVLCSLLHPETLLEFVSLPGIISWAVQVGGGRRQDK